MKVTAIRGYLAEMWRPIVLYGLLFGLLGALLFMRLGTLLPGYSGTEVATYQASVSLQHIFENPLNAPFALAVNGLAHLSDHSYLLARIVATLFGLAMLVVFCRLLLRWYNSRTAILGTILFGTSAWFLHVARLGVPEVLLLCLLLLVACSVWLKQTGSPIALLLVFATASLLLYVPGMIWLIFAGVVWQWKTIDRVFKHHLLLVTVGGIVVLAAMAPLGLAIFHDLTVAKVLIGLSAEGWPAPLAILRNLADVPVSIFAHAEYNPERWLGTLPVLDVFASAMFALGGFVYYRHFGLVRSKLVAFILVIGSALIALGGSVTITILLPFIYILVAVGLSYAWDQWVAVFPRNPIAQAAGIGLIAVTVFMACSYQMRSYFLAWPRNPDTQAVFTTPEP